MSSRSKKIFFRILRYTNQNFYHFLQFTVRKPELITIRSFFEQRSNKFFLQTDSIYYFPTYKQDIQLCHFLSKMDHCLTNVSIPGAPLTYFNDGGVRQRFIFYTQKNPNFRICLPKKIPTFFSIPKKSLSVFASANFIIYLL